MIDLIHAFDTVILTTVQSLGPSWYVPAWLLSSVITSVPWAIIFVVVLLVFIGKQRIAVEVTALTFLSTVVAYGLKYLLAIPRPLCDGVSAICYITETGYGLPSGHALVSMVVLGWLWIRHPRSLSLSLGVATILILVGLSRIYLGVHYPSQVLAGWVIGAVLLAIFYWMDKKYFRKRDRFVRTSAKLR